MGVIITVGTGQAGQMITVPDPNNPGSKINVFVPPGAKPGSKMAVPIPQKGESIQAVQEKQKKHDEKKKDGKWSTGGKVAAGGAALVGVGAIGVGGVILGQPNARFHLRGQDYEYSFRKMRQNNLKTHKEREIRPPPGPRPPKHALLPTGPMVIITVGTGQAGQMIAVPDPNNPGSKI